MKRYLLRYGIITILFLILLPLLPAFISSLQKTEITADIHKIEKASGEYLYKYDSSTFELFAGEKEDNPRITLIQGKRELDIQINTSPQATEKESTSKNNESGFLPTIEAQASESVTVINEDSVPAIEYRGANNAELVVTPNQHKIALTFPIESATAKLPSLDIDPHKFIPKQDGNNIIITTLTNRESFSLENAVVTDKNGVQDNAGLVLSRLSNAYFNISFDINNDWFQDTSRSFPLTLSVDTVSLFHERLATATPIKSDFAAFEKPEFVVDISGLEEPLKSAVAEKDYTNVKFGVIDAAGEGRQVPAQLLDENGKTILRFTAGGSIKPGLYDLLIQYKDEPSFIGEEEFSWGVLAINPDQSVYKPGQSAKIDMAVLDELGRIVCDANVKLEIDDPNGNKTTLSTKGGQIQISPECKEKDTLLPDYTTTYTTTAAGDYAMKLTATTANGTFTINDKFTVDPNSPFYVKRLGPTRIFPPKTYEMIFIVEAHKSAQQFVETIPAGFTIEPNPDYSISGKSRKKITWEKPINEGETYEFSYKFRAPSKSPAIFFLGPLKIGLARDSGPDWQEPRTWQLAIDDTGYIDPNADGTVAGNPVTCGGGGNYDCLDEQTRQPTAPSTSGDYVDFDNIEKDFYDMTTLTVGSVSQIDVWVYHEEQKNNMITEVSLWDTDEITQYGSVTDLPQRLTAQWDSATFGSLTLTQAQLDNLNVLLHCYKSGSGGPDDCESYAMYGYVTYSPPAAGPTNAQLLRHGNWFSSGVEQTMTF